MEVKFLGKVQFLAKWKKRRVSRRKLILCVLAIILCASVAPIIHLYQGFAGQYASAMSLAQGGAQHLENAITMLKTLPNNPFDTHTISQSQNEFASAGADFNLLDQQLHSLPGISTSAPVVGTRLSAALHVLPVAVEASQLGGSFCSIAGFLISKFHNPLDTHNGGLSLKDYNNLVEQFHQIKDKLELIVNQVNHLQPADLQVDARLSKMVTTFHKDIPALQTWLNQTEAFIPVVPTLLGIGSPTNYLVEILDSTELRPGGGFIGNYGIATLSGAQFTGVHITDTYLLDRPFEGSGKVIPYPSSYKWFDLAPDTWTLRDSNLDADFPTAARYSESNYKQEGGNVAVQGVIAITPAFIQQGLEITGPIDVPEYHEKVTAQNLIDRIHFHQLGTDGEGTGTIASSDGLSSVRKHFTALLGEHFLARVRSLPLSQLVKFIQLIPSAIHSKEVQIYFNNKSAESLLQNYHFNSSIQSPAGDSLFVVDANISPNKANNLITNTMNDQVSIDAQGNVLHHTTITYAWLHSGLLYGSPLYRDYLRIYVPPDSILHSQAGWSPRGTGKAFGRTVWAGFFTLTQGHSITLSFVWTVPHAATRDKNGWHYYYLVQRQAGATWNLRLAISLQSCVKITNVAGGLVHKSGQVAQLNGSLTQDMNFEIDYSQSC